MESNLTMTSTLFNTMKSIMNTKLMKIKIKNKSFFFN